MCSNVSAPGQRMSSKLANDISPHGNELRGSKHPVSIRRNQSFKRLSNERELVIIFQRRAGQLPGGVEIQSFQVETVQSVHVVAVGWGNVHSSRVPSQSQENSQPARRGRLGNVAEEVSEVVTDNERHSWPAVTGWWCQTRFSESLLTLLLQQLHQRARVVSN